MKHQKGLIYKLGTVFGIFLVVSLLLGGVTTYLSQMSIYRRQCQRDITNVASYLGSLIEADGEDFLKYKKYYEEHYADVDIPIDADEYLSYEQAFNKLFNERYPGKTFEVDIDVEDLDEDVAQAWFRYTHLYWLITFEQARADFNLPYTYFLIPNEEKHTNVYMIDGERTSRADHIKFLEEKPEYMDFDHYQGDEAEYLYLNDEYGNPRDEHVILWTTWETGEPQKGYKVWHNYWGDTYSYYVPVWIDHEKVGLAVTEVDIADVNAEIIRNTLRQLGIIAAVLLICLAVAMTYLNRTIILRIVKLENCVQKYTSSKDAAIAETIENNIKGHDEIVSLSRGIVSMIIEIENHIKSLVQVNAALADEKSNSARLSDMVHRDALTGIRNRVAYERELQRLEWELSDGEADFGIAMINMNFLKKINDTYGHEQGNIAIKKLCYIVCHVFEHSPVFRTGGDEFAVILKNDDYEDREALIEDFKTKMEQLQSDFSIEPWEQISAAIGVAVYEKEKDSGVDSVVKRADQLMHENKKEMKEANK